MGRRARADPAPQIELVFANPQDIRRYVGEFFTLARSMKKAQETSRGEVSLARNFEQLVELGQSRQSRRQRSARRPHRRLAVAVRLRAARLRHSHRAAARPRRRALPHRRRVASGLCDPDSGAAGDDQPHQAAGAHGNRRAAPAAGRAHQDRVARRRRDRIAHLDHADRVRREGRDADIHARSAGPRLSGAGFQQRGSRALGKDDQGAVRDHPRHRADRLGQDDDAVFDDEAARRPRTSTSARSRTRSR